jgi:hypothetical protein
MASPHTADQEIQPLILGLLPSAALTGNNQRMSDNTQNPNLDQTNLVQTPYDPLDPREPSVSPNEAEADPAKVEAIRAAFRDGDIALVEWLNPRTLLQAPWDMWYGKPDMPPAVGGMSVGFIYDLPEDSAIWVRSHMPDTVFFDATDEDVEEGDVVIPYTSVTYIRCLLGSSQVLNPQTEPTANDEPGNQH